VNTGSVFVKLGFAKPGSGLCGVGDVNTLGVGVMAMSPKLTRLELPKFVRDVGGVDGGG